MTETHLLQDLAVVMSVGAAATLICHKLRQPVVLGYLLAGLVVGPFTPPFALVQDLRSIHTMAELGLVFLMFALGLEFNLPKLKNVGASAMLAALLEVLGMLLIGFLCGRAFGWSRADSVFLGAILSISSTTIIIKVFMDLKLTREAFAQAVFGILILEDVVAILILSVLAGLGPRVQAGVLISAGKIVFFMVLFLTLGLSLLPRFVHAVARFQSKEILGVVALGLCLSGAWLAHAFGFSVALGAFLMGAIIGASDEVAQIEDWFHPVRDMFGALFFVSAGMLIQPGILWSYKGPILVVTLVTLVGKAFSGALGSFLAGYKLKTSFKIGFSLSQIGEFSFVFAALGLSTGVTSDFLYPLAVGVSSLTTLCTPYMVRHSDRLVDRLLAALPAGLQRAVDEYEARLDRRAERKRPPETLVWSKYMVRLIVYVALFAGALLAAKLLSARLAGNPAALTGAWVAAAAVCLPLGVTIPKYANHLMLLLATRSALVLRVINVKIFYRVLFVLHAGLLAAAFVLCLDGFAGAERPAAVVLGAAAAGLLLRKYLLMTTERLEELLDEVLGLATSEPTRQAVLRIGDRGLLLSDITEQVVIAPGSGAAEKNIRDLRIREKTGASIVAIYRHGKHVANPSPETTLLPDDVLVLFGEKHECEKARELLA